jgi:hypothetical protein
VKTLKRIIAGVLLLGIVVLNLPMDYHENICFHCRCKHEVGTILGIPYKSYSSTSVTSWYAERFPSHLHQWLHLGHYRTAGCGGMVCSSVGGSSMMMNPFWAVSEREHFDFLKSATAVETYQLTSHLAEHRQRDAVNLVLGKQTPARVLCDGIGNFDACPTPVILQSAAVAGEGDRRFCSARCRDRFRAR